MFHRHTKAGTICRPVSGGMIPAVLLFHYFSCDCPLCTPMARRGQVRRIDKITPFKSGTKLSALCVYFIYIADLIGLEFQPCGQECFNVKSVLVIGVGSVLEIGVLGNVVLIRKERTHATQLEDALVSVHRRKLILAHQLFATKSSGEFPKGKRHKRNPSFISLAFLFCFDIIYGITFNLGQKKAGNLFRFPA